MSEAHKFVTVRRGNCPLVLTAPHGGTSSYLNSKEVLEERPDKPGVCKLSDLKTMELLHSIDEHIAIETGGLRPHIVALRCHRKYIDANRNYRVEADAAFHAECGLAKDIYTLYHESIEKAIEVASAGSPQGRVLHLDIHGMKPYADSIVAGTRNNTTCDRELAEKECTGFLYHLRQQFGAQVVLPAREGGDVARYKGGYTVQRHGDGGTGGRCDAIQLEFGAFLRLKRQREEVARNVATAASNTLLPMHSFLRALLHKHGTHVYWDERATERVITKLKRIHCFAPNDLRNKMKKRGVTSLPS
jgi:N-formylglutamate amidohydrolase